MSLALKCEGFALTRVQAQPLIWNNGTILGVGRLNGKRQLYVCGMRHQAIYDYPDCPQNCGKTMIKNEVTR